ncbi:MAG: hypothetical protein DME86_11970 [Verrucomicrobia bacterium]|nr:MAG: hypothetical protein DME86_11970 [Verrucomicrobiota bacterium]
MKTLYFGVVISLLTTSRAYSAASTPADTVRMFYNWYVHEVLNGAKPINQERTEIRKFVTERLLTEIDNRHKSAGGVELDPFFNTREIDPEWGKNVAIGNLYVGRIARLNVILTGRQRGDREFKIKLVQENGAWKIDEVDSN